MPPRVIDSGETGVSASACFTPLVEETKMKITKMVSVLFAALLDAIRDDRAL